MLCGSTTVSSSGFSARSAPRMTAALVPVAPDVKMWLPCSGKQAERGKQIPQPTQRHTCSAARCCLQFSSIPMRDLLLSSCSPPPLFAAAPRAHRQQHGVGQHLDELLVHEAHVAGAEEPKIAWLLVLNG